MALKAWKCPKCALEYQTKTNTPSHCDVPSELVISGPQTKFMEKKDAERGISQMVGQEKILRERARKHSRDVEMGDLIETNSTEAAYMSGWLDKDGKKRRAIDDL